MKAARPTLRREIVLGFLILLAGAILVAAISLTALLPLLDGPFEAFLLILILLLADVGIVGLFGRTLLNSRLVRPIDDLVDGTGRIAAGDVGFRLSEAESHELESLRVSINSLADELLSDQALLAENVASLEATNAELVEARNEVLRTARLATVGTLAAGIAHEVGNPLGALVGFADLARIQAEREGRDPELLIAVREEASRIDRIIRTLLAYARGRDQGAVEVDPGQVVHRVRGLLESQGRLEAVAAVWPPETTGMVVRVETQQLEQVLVNLLLNALDAMEGSPDPGFSIEITEEAGEVQRLPTRREDDHPAIDYRHRRRVATDLRETGPDLVFSANRVVVLTIQDNGPGLPPELLDRVFDPFFTTKEPGKGTGLGLAICDRLVDGMGGRIVVQNAKEGGALFTLRIPMVVAGTEE